MNQTTHFDPEQIYTQFYPKVLGFLANRLGSIQDAEDLAQTVFLKVYDKLSTFDPEKSALSTWVFNITRNTLIDHHRTTAFRRHEELPETLAEEREGLLESLVLEEEQELLADALQTLSTEARDLIVLHYYSEKTLLEIAELLHRPYGQVKRLHQRTLEQLRLALDPDRR